MTSIEDRAATTIQSAFRGYSARKSLWNEAYESRLKFAGKPDWTCSICLEGIVQKQEESSQFVLSKLPQIIKTSCEVREADGLTRTHPHFYHLKCAKSFYDLGDALNCPDCRSVHELGKIFRSIFPPRPNTLSYEEVKAGISKGRLDPRASFSEPRFDPSIEVTPLAIAIFTKQQGYVRAIIESGIDINSPCDGMSRKPIEACIAANNPVAAQYFIDLNADLNTKSPDGDLPLHLAAMRNCTEITQFLVDAGADIDGKCGSGWTPLHASLFAKAKGATEILIKAGADTRFKIDGKFSPAYSYLHSARESTPEFEDYVKSALSKEIEEEERRATLSLLQIPATIAAIALTLYVNFLIFYATDELSTD